MDHDGNIIDMSTHQAPGFLGECSCGWDGRTHRFRDDAERELEEHLEEEGGLVNA